MVSARTPNRRSGMTLIEALIATSVAAILLGAVMHSLQAATGLFESTTAELEVDRRVRRAVQELREVLENARGSTMDPALPAAPVGGPVPFLTDFRFQAVTGWDGDDVTLGPAQRLFLRIDPAEVDNGTDDDGDGLVDELEVVLTRDADAADPVLELLARDVLERLPGESLDGTDENGNGLVDEPGFSITEDEGRVTVRFASGLVDDSGTLLVRTSELVVRTQP